jgi:hypothetical protein
MPSMAAFMSSLPSVFSTKGSVTNSTYMLSASIFQRSLNEAV